MRRTVFHRTKRTRRSAVIDFDGRTAVHSASLAVISRTSITAFFRVQHSTAAQTAKMLDRRTTDFTSFRIIFVCVTMTTTMTLLKSAADGADKGGRAALYGGQQQQQQHGDAASRSGGSGTGQCVYNFEVWTPNQNVLERLRQLEDRCDAIQTNVNAEVLYTTSPSLCYALINKTSAHLLD